MRIDAEVDELRAATERYLDDAGSAPVPAVVEPDLDPVIGRKILDLPS